MAGPPSPRQQKVGDLLRAEISEILRMRMRDPRVGFVTVTDVTVTRDLRHASVFVSVLGEEEKRPAVLGVLKNAAGFVRSELGQRVELKHIPELRFKMDTSAEYGIRISSVLKKIIDEPPDDGS
jgi:ribosome-binding factor A